MANRLDLPPNNSLYYSVPTPAPAPQVDPRLSMRQRLENLSAGLGYGLTGQLEDLRSLATDPVGYGQNVLRSLRAVAQQPSILGNALRESARRAASGPLGAGEVAGGLLPLRPGGQAPVTLRITEPQKYLDEASWHGSPNPAFDKFDPAAQGEFKRRPALGHGYYVGQKYYAKGFMSDNPNNKNDSLTKWRVNIKNSVYFDDSGFTPNTPRATTANRKAFEAVKKVDPELAYRVFLFDKNPTNRGHITLISPWQLKYDANNKPYRDYSDFNRAMDIAGIDSVVDVQNSPTHGKHVHQIMVRDPANLTRVE